MKPADGNHTLVTDAVPAGPGGVPPAQPSTSVTYLFDSAGMHTTFGILEWVESPPPGLYFKGDIAVRFIDTTHFVAVNGSAEYSGTWS